jgi:hypothetical protein
VKLGSTVDGRIGEVAIGQGGGGGDALTLVMLMSANKMGLRSASRGVQRGVSKGIRHGRRVPALWAPTHKAFSGVATHRALGGRAWWALAIP